MKFVCYSDFLTQNQIIDLTNQANGGDTEAAVKLFHYYFDAEPDMKQELKWLTVAAQNGDAGSQYNLGVFYSSKGDYMDLTKAKFWFEKASSNGVVEAESRLIEIQEMKK